MLHAFLLQLVIDYVEEDEVKAIKVFRTDHGKIAVFEVTDEDGAKRLTVTQDENTEEELRAFADSEPMNIDESFRAGAVMLNAGLNGWVSTPANGVV